MTPADWRLLTTHKAATFAQALQITHFYRQRWTIEQVFRVMKTKGFDIEAVRVAEDGPFENLAAATLIAAVQVLQMVRERDGGAARPLDDAFDPEDRAALEAMAPTRKAQGAHRQSGNTTYMARQPIPRLNRNPDWRVIMTTRSKWHFPSSRRSCANAQLAASTPSLMHSAKSSTSSPSPNVATSSRPQDMRWIKCDTL